MFSHFNHALQLSSTTLHVSVINTASNFLTTVCINFFSNGMLQHSRRVEVKLSLKSIPIRIFQAVLGHLFFKEVLNRTWWVGTALVIAGTALIGTNQQDKSNQNN